MRLGHARCNARTKDREDAARTVPWDESGPNANGLNGATLLDFSLWSLATGGIPRRGALTWVKFPGGFTANTLKIRAHGLINESKMTSFAKSQYSS